MKLPRKLAETVANRVRRAAGITDDVPTHQALGLPATATPREVTERLAEKLGITQRGTISPQEISELTAFLEVEGFAPPTTVFRQRADDLVDRLNAGDTMITDEDLLNVDWGRVHQGVDIPMDEASRMARAREQGYVYGLDEDIYRGLPTDRNQRGNPLSSDRWYDDAGSMPDRIWGSNDYETARTYTSVPRDAEHIDPTILDFSNQDYIEAMPQVMVVDGNLSTHPGAAGTTMFRMAGREADWNYPGEGEFFNRLATDRSLYQGEPVPEFNPYMRRLGDMNPYVTKSNKNVTNTNRYVLRTNQWDEAHGTPNHGVVFNQIMDSGPNRRGVPIEVSDVYALPPERVRARDLAMFHPLLQGRRGMLAGTAGAALAPYTLGTPYGTQE